MQAVTETKVKAGTAAGAVTGLIIWALVSYVPWFRDGVPEPVAIAIPVILAWAGHTIAAWAAPHTRRPDLAQNGDAHAAKTPDQARS